MSHEKWMENTKEACAQWHMPWLALISYHVFAVVMINLVGCTGYLWLRALFDLRKHSISTTYNFVYIEMSIEKTVIHCHSTVFRLLCLWRLWCMTAYRGKLDLLGIQREKKENEEISFQQYYEWYRKSGIKRTLIRFQIIPPQPSIRAHPSLDQQKTTAPKMRSLLFLAVFALVAVVAFARPDGHDDHGS